MATADEIVHMLNHMTD
nr:triokinase {peptide 2} {EC 2.7.1.28} [Swine, kidney, Peptide Partial, 16 aa] [Sus scrofa]